MIVVTVGSDTRHKPAHLLNLLRKAMIVDTRFGVVIRFAQHFGTPAGARRSVRSLCRNLKRYSWVAPL